MQMGLYVFIASPYPDGTLCVCVCFCVCVLFLTGYRSEMQLSLSYWMQNVIVLGKDNPFSKEKFYFMIDILSFPIKL